MRVTVSVALGFVLLLGGGAFAAYRYDAASAGRLLPGITIHGVDVGEMSREQAIAAVSEATDGALERPITVRAGGERWQVTPGELGTTVDVERVVDRALRLSNRYAWPFRVFYRLADRPVHQTLDVRFRYDQESIDAFVEDAARKIDRSPTNAAVDYVGGELVLRKPDEGQELVVDRSQAALTEALGGASDVVRLGVRTLEPEITAQDLGYTIVVDISELKLSLYQGVDLEQTYPVATGQPAYPTPTGHWEIVNKAVNPTWVNPAPDGWGAGLPASIPGGAGNPLGTRALYLDAPGIRIHGTYDDGSIGTYASHGCIRMHISDVEKLYDTVPIGTQVFIVP